MVRKILGGLLLAAAALILIGSIANGTLLDDSGSTAETLGTFIGTMLPIAVNVFAGLFLIFFDKVYKQNYIDGFKARKRQCSKIVLFIVLYIVFMFLAGIGAGRSGADNFIVAFLVSALPYFVPMMIFVMMLAVYAIPYWACQKNFNLDDSTLNGYLCDGTTFHSYSDNNSVLASNKALFFPKTFCIMPIDQIESTDFKNNGIEQDVIFTLKNGKKVEIVSGKKQYDSIVSAIAAHKQTSNS